VHTSWPLQEIRSLQSFLAIFNLPDIAPSIRIAHTIAMRMHNVCAICAPLCSADGSTHTESNKLYRKVKHRYRPNLSPRQRSTAKARHDQAALAASAEARGATYRARPSECFSLVPAFLSCTINHTLLVTAISCKGQVSLYTILPLPLLYVGSQNRRAGGKTMYCAILIAISNGWWLQYRRRCMPRIILTSAPSPVKQTNTL